MFLQRAAVVDDAHALGDPRRGHVLRLDRPDLRVVRAHEAIRDALAERPSHPGREVGVRVAVRARRLDEAEEALVGVLGSQVAEVVLERVRDPAAVEPDVRRALVLVDVLAERLLEQAVELAEVAEDDVPALVPGESGRIDVRRRVPARVVGGLVQSPVVVPEQGELAPAGEPAGPGADDGDVWWPQARHRASDLRAKNRMCPWHEKLDFVPRMGDSAL